MVEGLDPSLRKPKNTATLVSSADILYKIDEI
jgi:hypothetical protein